MEKIYVFNATPYNFKDGERNLSGYTFHFIDSKKRYGKFSVSSDRQAETINKLIELCNKSYTFDDGIKDGECYLTLIKGVVTYNRFGKVDSFTFDFE